MINDLRQGEKLAEALQSSNEHPSEVTAMETTIGDEVVTEGLENFPTLLLIYLYIEGLWGGSLTGQPHC